MKAREVGTDWFGETIPSFVFRPVHYLGSKLRVLGSIEHAINRVDPSGGPVCDLFSGSGTVARYLSRRRQVVAVDIQEYARVLAEAVLNGGSPWSVAAVEKALEDDHRGPALKTAIDPLIRLEGQLTVAALGGEIAPLCEFLEVGSLADATPSTHLMTPSLRDARRRSLSQLATLGLPGADTVCVRHFGGQYFSYAQAADLDALADLARSSHDTMLLAATLSTASHLVNSIGKQFAQPLRPRHKSGAPKHHVVKKIATERGLRTRSIFLQYVGLYSGLAMTRRDHVALRADYREALKRPAIKPAVVYADPPYTRDHYSRFYHSLETIALGDEPEITKSNLGGGSIQSRGGYRAGRHQSPFCIKSEAPGAFSALFAGVAALQIPLVLSYSGFDAAAEARPRVMELAAVTALAKKHFNNVKVEQITSVEHTKLNTTSLNKAPNGTSEVLLLCS